MAKPVLHQPFQEVQLWSSLSNCSRLMTEDQPDGWWVTWNWFKLRKSWKEMETQSSRLRNTSKLKVTTEMHFHTLIQSRMTAKSLKHWRKPFSRTCLYARTTLVIIRRVLRIALKPLRSTLTQPRRTIWEVWHKPSCSSGMKQCKISWRLSS